MMMNENPNKVYIKSNTAIVMRLLFFLSAVLMILVAWLSAMVIFYNSNSDDYYRDKSGKFYYTINNGAATIIDFVDRKTGAYEIPATVVNGGTNYPITTIGAHAFTNHHDLTAVVIPDSVTTILGDEKNEQGAFSGCTSLTAVKFGNGTTSIGKYAFKNCVALTEVDLPASVNFVQEGAFQGCLGLKTIRLNGTGNLNLHVNAFKDCLNVKTLKLAENVRLTDTMRQALAGLVRLNEFVPDAGSIYTAQDNCLLMKTVTDNDTVVLGGSKAPVPDGVIQILDWAWGKRAATEFFVPKSVTSLGPNSFASTAIYTDADGRPEDGWDTAIPVYPNAQEVTFIADEVERKAFIYQDEDGETVLPDYDDLFYDLESTRIFEDWGALTPGDDGSLTCTVIYIDDKPGEIGTLIISVEAAKPYIDAEKYIINEKLGIQFTIDFWEEFKLAYYTASAMIEAGEASDYAVKNLQTVLDDCTSKIRTVLGGYEINEIMENDGWRIGLNHLLSAIAMLDSIDLKGSNLVFDGMTQLVINSIDTYNEEDGATAYVVLRGMYESLVINLDPINAEIAACSELNSAYYTKDSWQELQACLATAKKIAISGHNLSVSVARKNLAAARENLSEVIVEDNLVRFNTWASLWFDLDAADYMNYDQLMLPVLKYLGNVTPTTNAELITGADELKRAFNSLEYSNKTPNYKIGADILNIKSLPYLIIAIILFTGAVVAGAFATRLKLQLRQGREVQE